MITKQTQEIYNEFEQELLKVIRNVPNFPKPGIMFKDITPILHDQNLCRKIIKMFNNKILHDFNVPIKIDAIAGIESRGFLFGLLLANQLGVPFILIRKAGKLPYKTISYSYDLEYGSATIEMQQDEIKPGWNVLIHDDLLATGGTAIAAANLVKQQQGKIAGFAFLADLTFLNGGEKLKEYSENIISLVKYKD